MPDCTISPTQDRSSADSSWNHPMSRCIREVAVVLSDPVARFSASVARVRDGTPAGAGRSGDSLATGTGYKAAAVPARSARDETPGPPEGCHHLTGR